MTPQLLWSPSEESIQSSNLFQYLAWLREKKSIDLDGYGQLWEWSNESNGEAFWESLWEYFEVMASGEYQSVLSGHEMPHFRWFNGARLNYAEHVFRKYNAAIPAIVYKSETTAMQEITWSSLKEKVSALQYYLLQSGVAEGDCVAAYMSTCPEATMSFLATNAIGAIWSSCSPDFGTQAVIDRFAQTQPKVLIVSQTYSYGGKTFDKSEVIREIVEGLPSVKKVIIHRGDLDSTPSRSSRYITWELATSATHWSLTFNRVPFSHPIWILYSSGTTGLPKAITHSHGGILLEHLKYLTFHNDIKEGDRCFWYTTTGWMMWNYIQSSLLCGATMVLYDGSPGWPDLSVLWKFVGEAGINHFGTSAGFILSSSKAGLHPGRNFNLTALKSIGSTGSTLPAEGFDWIYREVKKDLWLASISGGTDVCSAFVGGNPTWPVYSGEIQCRALGCNLLSYDEQGRPLTGEVGEMVIIQPMPSMPIYFWNDPGYRRYLESYFEMFPKIWRHGDWIQVTDRAGIIIYGRSDATLNRGGVRIGTSEVYRAVDKVKEVKDSLIVCVELAEGEFYMPLFVQMQDGILLTDAIRKKIIQALREDFSPRHVPDEIVSVPDIPYTISGKKTEAPVKKLLMGKDLRDIVNAGSLRNPDALIFFNDFYTTLSKTR